VFDEKCALSIRDEFPILLVNDKYYGNLIREFSSLVEYIVLKQGKAGVLSQPIATILQAM